jgi:hypothetical protein
MYRNQSKNYPRHDSHLTPADYRALMERVVRNNNQALSDLRSELNR